MKMKDLLAPSIMCGDLLNLSGDIKAYEEAQADLIHFDIIDTTFSKSTMLPPMLVPAIKKVTDIPLDIHVMIDRPERILDTLLPLCKDAYMSFHIETTKEIQNLVNEVHAAGGKAGVALNPGTPLCLIEEVAPRLDMVLIMTCNAAHGMKQNIDERMADKIRRTRALLDSVGREDAVIAVDGNISLENAKIAKENGANVFILGSASIYRPQEHTVAEGLRKMRAHLDSI